jgi:hypothetical protein
VKKYKLLHTIEQETALQGQVLLEMQLLFLTYTNSCDNNLLITPQNKNKNKKQRSENDRMPRTNSLSATNYHYNKTTGKRKTRRGRRRRRRRRGRVWNTLSHAGRTYVFRWLFAVTAGGVGVGVKNKTRECYRQGQSCFDLSATAIEIYEAPRRSTSGPRTGSSPRNCIL